MAATANLSIGGYYDDDCYVIRRRVLTPFQSPFCERGDRASSRKMGWRIEATCRKGAAGRHGRLDALSKHHPWYPMKAFDGTKEMTSTQTKLVRIALASLSDLEVSILILDETSQRIVP
jgi:hypothetical protein